MELTSIKLHTAKSIGKAETQITLDDDYNVPDYRPDIVRVIRQQGSVKVEEVKTNAGAVRITGKLIFRVLYRSDQEMGKISCLKGEVPFSEKLNMDGISEYDPVRADVELEDLTIGVIHSRKLNVRALLALKANAESISTVEIADGIKEETDCMQLKKQMELSQLLLSKRDICRQKNEIALPSSKPNIREILWKSIELRNVESRPCEEGICLNGEILVSILYSEEEEADRIQWYETTLPLNCKMEAEIGHGISKEKLFYKANLLDVRKELEVKPDYDGEERMLVLDIQLQVWLRVWEETLAPVLLDAYSLKKNLKVVQDEFQMEHLSAKNEAVCKFTEQMELFEGQEKILQICSVEGRARIEHVQVIQDEALVEGTLSVSLLYITTDDHMPIGYVEKIFPFEQTIELPQAGAELRIEQECMIEQLSAGMQDQSHAEIKVAIGISLLVFEIKKLVHITDIEETETDREELKKRPGMVGYIVKNGDTLWSVAKEYHTTPEDIMLYNQKKEEELKAGEKLLIVKEV